MNSIINQCLVQDFNDLTPAEKTEALDVIYDDLSDQNGIFIDGVMSMPFQNGVGVPVGRTVATIGNGVLVGKLTNRIGDMVEVAVNGVPYTANEIYITEVH
tara:strand:- start:20319 stop:20621 length:303 start_codon:yes stop_codon:yes gene_type:complete